MTRLVLPLRPSLAIVFSSSLALGAASAAAQQVSPPALVGVLAGPGAPPAPPGVVFYGTDLGWTFEHAGELRILFGDTWATDDSVCHATPTNDDVQGTLPLERPAAGAPTLTLATQPAAPTSLAPLRVLRGSESLTMGYGQVPLTGWSDGADATALFGRIALVRCETAGKGKRPSCRTPRARAGEPPVGPSGGFLECAEDLGACQPAQLGHRLPCDVASGFGCSLGQTCEPTDSGFCIDPTSSQLAGAAEDRTLAVAHEQEIGVARESEPATWDSVARWRTNKFINATARAVARFTKNGEGADWSRGDGALLVWGRPGWTADAPRQAHLYLAVQDLPLRRPDGRARFRPRYFAGLDARGRPRWSRSEGKAVGLAMDGVPRGSADDEKPLLGQTAIAWVPAPVSKWVMLYGGGTPLGLVVEPVAVPGAIQIRFADRPWGPWSPAAVMLAPGDAGTIGDPRGPGGVLFHPSCSDQAPELCTPSDPHRPIDAFDPQCSQIGVGIDFGFFYGVNLIDAYAQLDGTGGVDLYWNVSTWNPYGVRLYRTNVRPSPP